MSLIVENQRIILKILVRVSFSGQYLVVSAQQRISSTSFRQLVFSRQCELQSVSEPVAEQAPLVMWRPIGSVIAAVQRVSTVKQQVIFFERNGLRHGEFSLPLAPRGPVPADARALQLDYNADSEVLAVLMGDSPSVPGSTFLLLYTQNNFHYYLKQAICLSTQIHECLTPCPSLSLFNNLYLPLLSRPRCHRVAALRRRAG